MIFIFGLFTAGVLWALYNFALNELTRGTYLIKSYEKQISDLSRQNRELEVGFAESSFLGQVRAKTQELNFEKTTKVKYIQILDSAIATAKK